MGMQMVTTKQKTLSAELKLRLPLALRERVIRSATKRGISMNSEIVRCIESAYQMGRQKNAPRKSKLEWVKLV